MWDLGIIILYVFILLFWNYSILLGNDCILMFLSIMALVDYVQTYVPSLNVSSSRDLYSWMTRKTIGYKINLIYFVVMYLKLKTFQSILNYLDVKILQQHVIIKIFIQFKQQLIIFNRKYSCIRSILKKTLENKVLTNFIVKLMSLQNVVN